MRLPPKRLIVFGGTVLSLCLLAWLVHANLTDPIDSYTACATAGYQTYDTNPLTCSDGVRTFLGPNTTPPPSRPAITSVQFSILVDGDSKGNYPRQNQVITNQQDWQRYWSEVHAWLPAIPPILQINWSLVNVVAISEGPEPTNGYDYEVTSVAATTAGSIVNIQETIPTVTCKVQDIRSNRYYIIETPPLAGPVTFHTDTTKRQC